LIAIPLATRLTSLFMLSINLVSIKIERKDAYGKLTPLVVKIYTSENGIKIIGKPNMTNYNTGVEFFIR